MVATRASDEKWSCLQKKCVGLKFVTREYTEISDAVKARKKDVVAVSPIIAGAALKGPADRLLNELGHEASVKGVAKYYQDWISTLVIDTADFDSAKAIESLGVNCVVTETVMSDSQIAASLGSTLLGLRR